MGLFVNRKTNQLVKLLENEEVKSWRLLMDTFQAVFSRLEKSLLDEGLSVTRFQVLFHLYFEPDIKPAELSRRLLVTRGNMSMFLSRMERDSLIERKVPFGKKRAEMVLTTKGSRYFEKIFPRHIIRVKSLVKPLKRSTAEDLKRLLGRVKISKFD